MSDLDLDIRAITSASYGARLSASDVSQVAAAIYDQSSLASNTQASPDSSATQAIAAASSQPTFRYDSFRFIYQSDYGKIVLIDQNPETGKAVSQIPSQRALQLYAEQRRAEIQTSLSGSGAAPTNTAAAGSSSTTGRRGVVTSQTGSGTGVPVITSGTSARGSSTLTPTVSPTPVSTPPAAFIAAVTTPVNITI